MYAPNMSISYKRPRGLWPRKSFLSRGILTFLLLLCNISRSTCNIDKDFEDAPLSEDLDSLLSDESLLFLNTSTPKKANPRPNLYKEQFTSIHRQYEYGVNLLSEDALNSDFLPSEHNLMLDRHRREAYEGSGFDCSDSDLNECDGPFATCTETQNGYECGCVDGFVRESKECFAEILPYIQVTSIMTRTDEGFQSISCPDGIPFFSKIYYNLYISTNGVISFGNPFGRYYPFLPTNNQNILCPYWADMDVTESDASDAGIYYGVYDSTSSGSVLTDAAALVKKHFNLAQYRATWSLVVTWRNIAQKGFRSDTKTVTFQTVLVTDGQSTYAFYIYQRMAWDPQDDIPIYIGYESSSSDRQLESLFISGTRAAYFLSGIGSNTGIPGLYGFNIGGTVNNYVSLCFNWYNRYLFDFNFNRHLFDTLPICPCFESAIFFDWRFWYNREYPDAERYIVCYISEPSFFNWPLARECCYNIFNGLLMTSYENSGSALRAHPVLQQQHFRADLQGRRYCCDLSNRCDLYFQLRPQVFCEVRFPFGSGWGFGDPHITTLDDHTFIFNGHGEYTMILIEDAEFVLQSRTSLAISKDNTTTSATVFTAFAASDYNDTFFVELSPTLDGMIIYHNDKDVTLDFKQNANFTEGNNGRLTVRRKDDDVIGLFPTGLSVRVILGVRLLTFSVTMPQMYEGKTKGLMGNFNGDKSDDLIFPNGTMLSVNATEKEIFSFGQSWQISASESKLRYPPQKNASDFAFPDFTPLFLDEASEDDRNTAIQKCGGNDKDLPCIFDYLATRDEEVATSTKSTGETSVQLRKEQTNSAPKLSSNLTSSILKATLNEEVTFSLNSTDGDEDDLISYKVVEKPEGLSISEEVQTGKERDATVKWVPDSTNKTKISIIVEDSNKAKSEPVEVVIRLCDKCSGNGECDFDRLRDDVNSAADSFQLVACNCDVGWTGSDCSQDLDGCASSPCFQGQNCTDLAPEQEQAFKRAYNCSACPTGYELRNNIEKCQDIDECAGSQHGCDQNCRNSQGSFTCYCKDGYRMVESKCLDIDECVEGLHNCQQVCNNTNGGFACDCEVGFALNVNDSRTCDKDDIDVCGSKVCSYGCRLNDSATPECFCETGYHVDPANESNCIDTNECDQNVCSQDCSNNDGSFQCSCFAGFTLASDKISCQECTTLSYGEDCSQTCNCGNRLVSCDNVKGCLCKAGWRGVNCSVNIDECQERPDACPTGQLCHDNEGSYVCNCPEGFRKEADNTCTDINECDTDTNNCDQVCTNVPGSFTCSCNLGYKLEGNDCKDIDECTTEQNLCAHKCINVTGSYSCECEFGYRLMADRRGCERVEDVCKDIQGLTCEHGCSVEADTRQAFCFCNRGYKLATDKQACIDIVECEAGESGQCSQTCENTIGGYTCSCRIGYRLDNDQITCTECDDEHWGTNCDNVCGCGVGASGCDPVSGCQCQEGWLGDKCDQDRNECNEVTCRENAVCENSPGSYRCQCREGFTLNSTADSCQDVDECKEDALNNCDQGCINTVGSFYCTCRAGFTWTGIKCKDVDECETGKHDCAHFCRNTIGSYACYCRPGFVLQTTDRRTCVSEETCQTPSCSQGCQRENGAETCFCNQGFQLDPSDNTTCEDIDECDGNNPCASGGGECINLSNGQGYNCSCRDGLKLETDGVTCRECVEGKYGPSCENSCACVDANTESCNKVNGTCTCIQGWEGATCADNIDECTAGTDDCHNSTTCEDTDGSFICECDPGFFLTESGVCEGCDSDHWGTNCAQKCTCDASNSNGCNPINGMCSCKAGWMGTNCTEDRNECEEDTTLCSDEPNSNCSNNEGSYRCMCIDGYRKNATGICEDINECLDAALNTCLYVCENTPGNHTCSCGQRYTGSENNCTDIDECTENSTYCSDVPNSDCRNLVGGASCDCQQGFLKNATTGLCQDINECLDAALNTCLYVCENTPGNHTCSCGQRYTGSENNCTDIDECTENSTYCSDVPNSDCRNLVGGASCDCQQGFLKNATTGLCQDIDECLDDTLHNCSYVCDNTPGSFVCSCGPRYEGTGNNCTDIDECTENSTYCSGVPNSDCRNFVGGASCDCQQGFMKNATTGLCQDCSDSDLNECDGPFATCTETQNGYECGCVDGFVRENKECFAEILPYIQVTSIMTRTDEGFQSISCPDGIPFFSKIYYNLYISTNGVISFGNPFGRYYPFLPTNNQNILCPYWADMDVTESDASDAGIYYGVYDSTSSGSVLTDAAALVKKHFNLAQYHATWSLVVTWRNIAQKGFRSDTKTVTFQTVLVTDGQSTYAFYIYQRMAWDPQDDIPIYIGYESSSSDRQLESLFISGTRAAYFLSGIGSNTGIPGLYGFNIGGTVNNYVSLCFNWYNRYLSDFNFNRLLFDTLPICPCFESAIFFDWRFWYNREYPDAERYIVCYISEPSFFNWPLARECCYNIFNGLLMTSYENSGSALRAHPVLQQQHFRADLQGRRYCCDLSNRCDLYFQLRPQVFCEVRFPFGSGWGFGDPHITTLDDHTFIFNGHGEYTMILIEDAEFVLQSRTSLAISKDNTTTSATVFTAFAASDYNDTFFVELSPTLDGMIIYHNDKDVTLDFKQNANFTEGNNGRLTVRRKDDDVIGLFPTGLSVRVILGVRLLTFSVTMPQMYEGKTKGLMGNFNGDKSDDLIFPNGTMLSVNATEKEIFSFGQSWQISASESKLRYPPQKNASDFAFPDFTPLFLDEASEDDRNTAIQKCGGNDKDLPCIFDYLATQDEEVAKSTKSTGETSVQLRKEQTNSAPKLSSNLTSSILNATLNEEVTFSLNSTDGDEDDLISYKVVEKPEGLSISTEVQTGKEREATVKWVPDSTNKTKISIIVEDSNKAKSEPVEVVIRLCDKCSGNGECDFDRLRNDVNSAADSFQLVACNCDVGWTGSDCSQDFNGCASSPCFQGQNCTDLAPEQEEAFKRAYNCSACPTGYQLRNNIEKCQDIDECAGSQHGCDQKCRNSQGSFTCYCKDGYRMVESKCLDIDECVEGLHNCQQVCNNNNGGFACDCEVGFVLNVNDSRTCDKDDTDVCGSKVCLYGCRLNDSATPECFCETGYHVDPANESNCIDTNECDQNVCSQECSNNDGSFQCSCFAGFTLASDKISCQECTTLSYGEDCSQTCNCGNRLLSCDNVKGCVCKAGWRGVNCSVNINECHERPDACPTGQLCHDNEGSYVCNCPEGFRKEADNTCTDINECDTDTNNCDQVCTNVPGSFTCSCNLGYKLEGNDCKDIDECTTEQNLCAHKCINVTGSYSCECEFGYRLMADRRGCERVEDVCKDIQGLTCEHGCSVEADTRQAFCFCNRGYKLATDKQACIDIVECEAGESGQCSQTCENTIGGYTCSCRIGYRLNNDQITCTECDDEHWGTNCDNVCGCGVGASGCDPVSGCQCQEGWLGDKCDQDRNECNEVTCRENAVCENSPGSYRCQCREGFTLNSTTDSCQDVDECKEDALNDCDQGCINTVGSFYCTCRAGFTWTGIKCKDVDECETGKHDCAHFCRNTIGSYACYCRPGFVLQTTDRRTCVSEETCQTPSCSQGCQRENGVETCFCNQGFQLDPSDNTTCEDIDECDENNPCASGGGECINLSNGQGYNCSCRDGLKLETDGVTCRECVEGKYGPSCENSCACVDANTESCNKVNGTCTCIQGWEGVTCADDIDECVAETDDCHNSTTCEDTDGSFICKCDPGFFLTESGVCEGCDSDHWGTNCAQKCTCDASNSNGCNPINGMCSCKAGWMGTNCTEDRNECEEDTTLCSDEPNSNCSNNEGSFRCMCIDGYRKNATGICEDINECLDTALNTCLYVCENTPGNHTCSCGQRYTGSENNCTDIDECKENSAYCSGVPNSDCRNFVGGASCDCQQGFLKNATTGLCQDIDECLDDTLHNCSYVCDNTPGSFVCSCGPRYEGTGNNCTDVNECSNSSYCSGTPNSFCENVIGGDPCKCMENFEKDTATGSCEDIDECLGDACQDDLYSECKNLIGNYTCECKVGFIMSPISKKCDDINECNNNATLCAAEANSHCVNAIGSFSCTCNSGYAKPNQTEPCTDSNECEDDPTICDNKDNQKCRNLAGTHACDCADGFTRNSQTQECDDSDECGGNHGCQFQCKNTNGSFECLCDKDQILNSDNKTCDSTVTVFAVTRLDIQVDFTTLSSDGRAALIKSILEALTEYFRGLLKSAFVKVIVHDVKNGSVIANYSTTLNKKSDSNAEGLYVKALSDMKQLTVANNTQNVISHIIGGQTVVPTDLCAAYREVRDCGQNAYCTVDGGTPVCKLVEGQGDIGLIIGLSIGIPLFVILLAVTVAVILLRMKRKKTSEHSDERTDVLHQAFPARIITRGGFYGKDRGMYSPDSLSMASSDSDVRRKQYLGSLRGSNWFNRNRPVEPDAEYDHGNSNFSWDFLYRVLPPRENFEIRRPHISPINVQRSPRDRVSYS